MKGGPFWYQRHDRKATPDVRSCAGAPPGSRRVLPVDRQRGGPRRGYCQGRSEESAEAHLHQRAGRADLVRRKARLEADQGTGAPVHREQRPGCPPGYPVADVLSSSSPAGGTRRSRLKARGHMSRPTTSRRTSRRSRPIRRRAICSPLVAGTDQARDAVLENKIPQTAEVSIDSVTANVKFDGEPKFEPSRGRRCSMR